MQKKLYEQVESYASAEKLEELAADASKASQKLACSVEKLASAEKLQELAADAGNRALPTALLCRQHDTVDSRATDNKSPVVDRILLSTWQCCR
ncbi:hypothetical protein V499_09041 [Pseudogymnoascus sp. VKM F-103]|nr:hypothetical protein V499_09041 [Pseudogymnoascus sp. VKM F-103]